MAEVRGVLVVGGGIAGFGLARALTMRGVPVRVVERLARPPQTGLGLNLPASAVRALAALGVAGDVVRAGVPVRRREYRNQSGRVLFAVNEAAFWGDVGQSVCLRRAALLDVLRAAVAPGVVRWNSPVSLVEATAHNIRVQVGAGPPEEHDYVVGADGVQSAVRPAVAGVQGVRPSVMTAESWRFVVPNPGVDCWTAWSGSGGTLLLIPVDGQHVYGYASSTTGGATGDHPDWLADTFGSFPEPVRNAVDAAFGRAAGRAGGLGTGRRRVRADQAPSSRACAVRHRPDVPTRPAAHLAS